MRRIKAHSKKYGNKYIYVDDADYDFLKQFSWTVDKYKGRTLYAVTKIKGKKVKLHRLLMKPKRRHYVDHINHNGLDNRRSNLRFATHIQNARNNKGRKRRGRYKGVSMNNGRHCAYIYYRKKKVFLGYYTKAKDAAKAYNEAAIKYHKEFAVLNKI